MPTAEFLDEIIKAHNEYRAKHSVPNLEIDDELNKFAQEWADNLGNQEKMEHRPENPYGENLYMASSTDPNWKLKGDIVVKSWYDEIKFYKFGEPSPKNTSKVGHFTQLLWRATNKLGIGEAKSKAGKVYVVCNYDPPGNVLGEFAKNVPPLENSSQKENGEGYSVDYMEEVEGKDKILRSSSQGKSADGRFVQPNIKIVESMEQQLRPGVPEDKIRMWSVWLAKVEKEADEWHSWLRSHIDLVLRMCEYLQRIEEQMREEKENSRDENENVDYGDESAGSKNGAVKVAEVEVAADVEQDFEVSSLGSKSGKQEDRNESTVGADTMQTLSSALTKEIEKRVEDPVVSGVVEAEPFEAEQMEEASRRLEKLRKVESDDGMKEKNAEEEEIQSDDEKKKMEKEAVESDKIAWTIGVTQEQSEETTSMREKEVPKKKKEQVQVIPIPGNEKDMLRLIEDVKRQAAIYRSLYKHCLEIADRAIKEIVNTSGTTMIADECLNFFDLNIDPQVEIGADRHDETNQTPNSTREKITCEFTSLYFNLSDNPNEN